MPLFLTLEPVLIPTQLISLPKQTRYFWLFVYLLIALLIFIRPVAALELEPVSCADFINESPPRVTCGFVAVPLDHDNPKKPLIRLPVLIAHSTRSLMASSENAILIPGAGGPGAAMGFGYQYAPGEFLAPYASLLQAGFDVVIMDQRGAGLSSPRLSCHETIISFERLIVRERTVDEEISQYEQSTRLCRERLKSLGIPYFDTHQSANDFLAVMDSLAYRWWGTIATSYATAIAQAMLHIEPDAFQRVVLDSPVPLDYQKPLTLEGTYDAVKKSITLCQTNKKCTGRYPALAKQFDEVIARAKAKPYRTTINVVDNSYNSIRPTLVVDDATLLSIFANAVYSNNGIAALPATIDSLHKGRIRALRPFAQDYWYQSTDNTYADGLNLTVHCKERQLLEDQYVKYHPDYLASLSIESRQVLATQPQLCRVWNVKTDNQLLPQQRFKPTTLVLAGSLDPVISNEDISHTTDDFSRFTTTVISGAGHAVWFQSECVRDSVVSFFTESQTNDSSHCQVDLPAFK